MKGLKVERLEGWKVERNMYIQDLNFSLKQIKK